MPDWKRSRGRPAALRCTLCGGRITRGEEYWACNGCLVCAGCLPELARRELAPYHEIFGEEAWT